jgi:sugar lactone lactonase YvrE
VRMLLSFSAPMPQAVLVIASGLPARTDPAALVIGPTGLALSASGDRLFVNDSLKNRMTAISDPLIRFASAGKGATLSQGKALVIPSASHSLRTVT